MQTSRLVITCCKVCPPCQWILENNPHANCLDFQIEADFAGIMSPGMVNSAVDFVTVSDISWLTVMDGMAEYT